MLGSLGLEHIKALLDPSWMSIEGGVWWTQRMIPFFYRTRTCRTGLFDGVLMGFSVGWLNITSDDQAMHRMGCDHYKFVTVTVNDLTIIGLLV